MADKRDYEIGYKKPPLHTRFSPGQSGNPNGRPKKRPSFTNSFLKELDRRVTVIVDGRSRSITQREAIVMQLTRKASAGDIKSAKLLIDLLGVAESHRGEAGVPAVRALEALFEQRKAQDAAITTTTDEKGDGDAKD
jgi:hypothetical protein